MIMDCPPSHPTVGFAGKFPQMMRGLDEFLKALLRVFQLAILEGHRGLGQHHRDMKVRMMARQRQGILRLSEPLMSLFRSVLQERALD